MASAPATSAALPPASVGVGLRAPHYRDALATLPDIGWFEVHSENYFGAGGAPHHYLEAVRADYALSFHGVGLSLGSTDPLETRYLKRLRELIRRYEPALVSDHLSWSSIDGRHVHDLLPLPYTEEALAHIVTRVRATQDILGRTILVENPSSYLQYTHSTIREWEFLAQVADAADCAILLDVNNVYVSACNHGFDAHAYLRGLPRERVHEIHLAGHTRKSFADGDILIDTHNAPVADAVWALYDETLAWFGARPTLIEWDTDLPPFERLLGEARQANDHLRAHDAVAA